MNIMSRAMVRSMNGDYDNPMEQLRRTLDAVKTDSGVSPHRTKGGGLKVDVAAYTHDELHGHVAGACSRYGSVKSIDVYVDGIDPFFDSIARVSMSTRAENSRVAEALGGHIVGNSVIIPLRPDDSQVVVLAHDAVPQYPIR